MLGRRAGMALTVLITACFLLFYYSHDIFNADSLAYGAWGDGYKNFYTLAYYSKYDSGPHFSGMNYPYGENIVFTDNQPVISFLLLKIGKIFPDILNHLHAIVTFLLFFSMLCCSGIIYLLLVEFGVSLLLASILSSFITVMNPQWDHFLGLYSLAYCVYFPALLLVIFKLLTGTRKLLYTILGILIVSFFSFIHLYNLSFSLFFASCFVLSLCVFHIKYLKKYLVDIIGLTAIAVLPVILVKIFLVATDVVTDRPSAPWGYFAGATQLHYLLLHPNSFLYYFIKSLFPSVMGYIRFGYDAKCFLGIVTVLMIVVYLVFLLKRVFSRKKPLSQKDEILLLFFLSSIPILLFAMTIPLKFDLFRPLYDSLPAGLKQFRAAARFSWIFYYSASLVSAITLQKVFSNLLQVNKPASYIFLGTTLSIWFIDMNTTSNYQKENFKAFSNKVDEKEEAQVIRAKLLKAGYDFSTFQAIFPLPIYLLGSEKLSISSSANFSSMRFSLESGLPLVCGQLSRTSISQSYKISNLLSHSYLKKGIINDYLNQKPLLLTIGGNDLTNNEKLLIEKGAFLFEEDGVKFFKLPFSAFKDSTKEIKQLVSSNFQSLKRHPDYISDSEVPNVVYKTILNNDFGSNNVKQFPDNVSLYDGVVPFGDMQTQYEFSVWLYTGKEFPDLPVVYFKQFDSTGTNLLSSIPLEGKYSNNTFGDWVRVSTEFKLQNKNNRINVTGKNPFSSYDELMIRPSGVSVITSYKNDSVFQFNNFPIR